MPPQLALIITTFFVIFIIYIEHQQNKEISKAIWIPTLWILYSASKGLGYWFNTQTTIESGSPLDRYFLLALGLCGIIILQKRSFSWSSALKNNYLLISIVFYMLISNIWSKVPVISFRHWGREVIALIIGCVIVSEKYPFIAFISIFKKFIYIALPFSLLLIKFYPELGRDYHFYTGELTWIGIAGQKNGLALICSFSAIFLIWSLWKDLSNWKLLTRKMPKLIDLSMLILAIYLLLGPRRTFTYSSTSFSSLLVGLISILLLKKSLNKGNNVSAIIIFIAIIIILIGTLTPFTGKIPIKEIPEMLGRDATLTGRTHIWNALVPYAQKKLILGHGFAGFWTTSIREQIAVTAHNGYLDTILNLGLVGLLLFSFFLTFFILKSHKFTTGVWDISLLFTSMIFMFLVHNIAEASLGYLESFPSSLIVLASFIINSFESNITNNAVKKPMSSFVNDLAIVIYPYLDTLFSPAEPWSRCKHALKKIIQSTTLIFTGKR